MSNVVQYSDFFYMKELKNHIKQFESENNTEVVIKLLNLYRNNLTSLQKCAKDTKSPAALVP